MTSKITTIVIIVFFAWQAYSERKVKKHENPDIFQYLKEMELRLYAILMIILINTLNN
ncbi:hypothetical protein [Microaceticoccus formicicus]|uniref:hypothetical protein n=1 Tax=Microaceticoccus formicicus TaxID=3118105 RepID=UPI003CD007F9|nr:hypothetical protein VZL98_00930 [Peptoniphilaceae bacterium AMB_02]